MDYNNLKKGFLALSTVMLVSCGGGGSSTGGTGGTGGGGTVDPGPYTFTNPDESADNFVAGLNSVDGASSFVELYEEETFRTYEANQDEWFVIWDDKFGEYKAFSLQYIRAIEYVDYVRNSTALASEFRAIESDDIAYGDYTGDYYGDDYEVVDYDPVTDVFYGRNSGYEYEDGQETTDVNLMAAEKEQMKFFKKAAAVSYEFQVNISTAMSLVTLGSKVEAMKSKGEMSGEDMIVLSKDLQKLSGITIEEAMTKPSGELLDKAAKKLGTSAMNLEQRLLPELFGVQTSL